MFKEYNQNNVFAKIIRKEISTQIIYENNHALAFYDIAPQTPIHILVIPKGYYIDVEDFCANSTPQEAYEFNQCVMESLKIIKLSRDGDTYSGFRVISNAREDGGQEVPHYHIHILGGKRLSKMLND